MTVTDNICFHKAIKCFTIDLRIYMKAYSTDMRESTKQSISFNYYCYFRYTAKSEFSC